MCARAMRGARPGVGARFVALYGRIARDYILDDMEPEYSIIYVTLQLFTTPTIAAYLVAEHDLLTTLLETLYDHFHQALIPASAVPCPWPCLGAGQYRRPLIPADARRLLLVS